MRVANRVKVSEIVMEGRMRICEAEQEKGMINSTLPNSRLFVEVILIVERFGWLAWREFFNPQSNPHHVASCTILNDLGGPWQSPRFCKLL
jgi:hypothetical protein